MSAKLEHIMHFNFTEVVLKSNYRYTKVELLQVYLLYSLNILHYKINIIQKSYNYL